MNNIKLKKFITAIFYLFMSSVIALTFLTLFFNLAMVFNITLPNDPAIKGLTQVNVFDIIKMFLFIGIVYFILFILMGVPIALKVSYQGRKVGDWTHKERAFQENFGRLLLGSYIPLVALLSLSKNQFSSLVDISALGTIFIFFFNFGKIKK
ncbi:alkylphosphonate ABC transporter permease [Lactococcus lactis]|uniref:alkylphosphonate ABC transporter permease n=1 Tax=Lactococcus lactis TaxID=1358 RepID=UPI0021A4D165|nr:alkylphosphonate ABC transporter permease [Lactococcus lactis]MCT2920643.1 alkylphosphonate ABC transporter permease [Lactococcus lactis]